MESNNEVRRHTIFIQLPANPLHGWMRLLIGYAIGARIDDPFWSAVVHRRDADDIWLDAGPLEIGRIATEVYRLMRATHPIEPLALIDYPEADEVRHNAVRRSFLERSGAPHDESPPFLLQDPLLADNVEQPDVLAVAIASEAAQHAAVINFRKQFLDNELVPEDQIGDWVQAQARAAGRLTLWIDGMPLLAEDEIETVKVRNFPASVDTISTPLKPAVAGKKVWRCDLRLRLLHYWEIRRPTGGESFMPTAYDSPLEQLRRDSEIVAVAHGWTAAQATTFILTGAVPRQQQMRWGLRTHLSIGALSRIILTVDPTVSPREVAEQYRIAREGAIGRDKRPRQIDEKHLRLALIAVQKRSARKWATLMREWNEHWQDVRVDWIYKDAWNFSRDCVHAHKRLLGFSGVPIPTGEDRD